MYALRYGLSALGIVAFILVGCNTSATKKYDLKVKHEEAWVKPPDAPQYNNPPESDYKRPAKDKISGSASIPQMGGGQGMGGPPNGGMGAGMGR
jgi:hypothetical protein